MKKLILITAMTVMSIAANAQLNYKVQTACHPDDVKHYDTERLRSAFLMEKVMAPDEINLTYTLYDRLIYGGAMPVSKTLVLETFDDLKAEQFLDRSKVFTWDVERRKSLSEALILPILQNSISTLLLHTRSM